MKKVKEIDKLDEDEFKKKIASRLLNIMTRN